MQLRPSRRAVLLAASAGVLGLVVRPAAAVPPPSPTFGPAIDAYAAYQGQTTCVTTPSAGIVALRDMVRRAYPGIGSSGQVLRSCGSGGTSEHKDGRAWDWMVDARVPEQREAAYELLDWLTATDEHGNQHARLRRLGIMYMIYDGRVFKAYQASRGWQPYSGASPHTDHVHFSLGWPGAEKRTTWWTAALWAWEPGTLAATLDGDLLRFAGRSSSGTAVLAAWREDGLRESEDLGGSVVGGIGVSSRRDGTLVVAARGQNDALYVKERPPGGAWSAWQSVGATLSARPAIARNAAGGVDVVGRGQNGLLYTRSSSAPGTWSPWQVVPGLSTRAHGPALTDGGVLLAVGSDGAMWRTVRAGAGWSGWTSLGGSTADDLSAADAGAGGVVLAARGLNGLNYARTTGPAGDSGFVRLAGTPGSPPAVAGSSANARADVLAWGTNRRLYRATEAGGAWSPWAAIG